VPFVATPLRTHAGNAGKGIEAEQAVKNVVLSDDVKHALMRRIGLDHED